MWKPVQGSSSATPVPVGIDNTILICILIEGSAAFACDIIQLFRNGMVYIVNLTPSFRLIFSFSISF